MSSPPIAVVGRVTTVDTEPPPALLTFPWLLPYSAGEISLTDERVVPLAAVQQ